MVIHDIFILGESAPFEINTHEMAVVDLDLEKVPPCYHTLLTGKVFFKDLPLRDATVVVMDNNYSPLLSATTNEKGIYRISNKLKPGKYKVIASEMKYETSNTKTVSINSNEVTKLSFTLRKSLIIDSGIVYGKILEVGSGEPIENADIYLKSLKCDGEKIYTTSSNHNGQYLIYNILPDNYKIVIKKEGYMRSKPLEIKIAKHSHEILYFDLIKKPANYKNTITGKITYKENAITKVAVFLYLIDKEGKERIVQIQETNENGLYLFSNVESGTYLVKGKMQNSVIYEKSFTINEVKN